MKYVEEICEIFKDLIPEPDSELQYDNEWTFAVAVILSAQATDKRVNIITQDLFKVAKTPDDFIKLGLDGLIPYIKSINYFNNKGKNIIAAAHMVKDEFGGKLPHTKEGLLKIPGIGNKTAGVIINQLWDGGCIPVDTHVFRVAHRLGWASDKDNNPDKVSETLDKIIPQEYKNDISDWMVLHGRYTCVAKNPKCDICPITQYCAYYKKCFKS